MEQNLNGLLAGAAVLFLVAMYVLRTEKFKGEVVDVDPLKSVSDAIALLHQEFVGTKAVTYLTYDAKGDWEVRVRDGVICDVLASGRNIKELHTWARQVLEFRQ